MWLLLCRRRPCLFGAYLIYGRTIENHTWSCSVVGEAHYKFVAVIVVEKVFGYRGKYVAQWNSDFIFGIVDFIFYGAYEVLM